MANHDPNQPAPVSQVQDGTRLITGEGIPSLPPGLHVRVYTTEGPSPRLAINGPNGRHDLGGHLNPDGTRHGGTDPTGRYYPGLHLADPPDETP
jgi:hypothetical protein